MDWEVSGRKISWAFENYLNICSKTENFRAPQYGLCSDRDLNPAPSKYKVNILPFDRDVAVIFFFFCSLIHCLH